MSFYVIFGKGFYEIIRVSAGRDSLINLGRPPLEKGSAESVNFDIVKKIRRWQGKLDAPDEKRISPDNRQSRVYVVPISNLPYRPLSSLECTDFYR